MSRPIRVEFEDAVYHLMSRGNERRAIYRDDADRHRFLDTVAEMCSRFGTILHAFCLMPNHYHLVVQTPRANLSQAMGWLQTTYSVRFNHRHRRSGHLFQGRFKAQLVEADTYAGSVVKYIHLNPVRPADRRRPIPASSRAALDSFVWSSHRAYAGRVKAAQSPEWLCLDWLWYFGRSRREAHREYRRQIGQCFGRPASNPFSQLRGGLVLGAGKFWERVRETVASSQGGEEIRWNRHVRQKELTTFIDRLAADESDRRIQIWLRVRLGGERMVDVARRLGYANGSAVHQVIKRLEAKRQQDASLAKRLRTLEAKIKSVKS